MTRDADAEALPQKNIALDMLVTPIKQRANEIMNTVNEIPMLRFRFFNRPSSVRGLLLAGTGEKMTIIVVITNVNTRY